MLQSPHTTQRGAKKSVPGGVKRSESSQTIFSFEGAVAVFFFVCDDLFSCVQLYKVAVSNRVIAMRNFVEGTLNPAMRPWRLTLHVPVQERYLSFYVLTRYTLLR